MQIKITNKIEEKVNEYQMNTGATKTWIAKQLGMSNQNMFAIFRVSNPTLETLIKFSIFLGCDIADLFAYEIKNDDC